MNNRVEEALGLGIDFQVAARENLIGKGRRPFTGYLIVLEDEEQSHVCRSTHSVHFPADKIFDTASYAQRLNIMCERIMSEQLFDSACVITSPNNHRGEFNNLSDSTSIKSFLAAFAARMAEASV